MAEKPKNPSGQPPIQAGGTGDPAQMGQGIQQALNEPMRNAAEAANKLRTMLSGLLATVKSLITDGLKPLGDATKTVADQQKALQAAAADTIAKVVAAQKELDAATKEQLKTQEDQTKALAAVSTAQEKYAQVLEKSGQNSKEAEKAAQQLAEAQSKLTTTTKNDITAKEATAKASEKVTEANRELDTVIEQTNKLIEESSSNLEQQRKDAEAWGRALTSAAKEAAEATEDLTEANRAAAAAEKNFGQGSKEHTEALEVLASAEKHAQEAAEKQAQTYTEATAAQKKYADSQGVVANQSLTTSGALDKSTKSLEAASRQTSILGDLLLTWLIPKFKALADTIASVVAPNVEAVTGGFAKNTEATRKLTVAWERLNIVIEQGQQDAIGPWKEKIAGVIEDMLKLNPVLVATIAKWGQWMSIFAEGVGILIKVTGLVVGLGIAWGFLNGIWDRSLPILGKSLAQIWEFTKGLELGTKTLISFRAAMVLAFEFLTKFAGGIVGITLLVGGFIALAYWMLKNRDNAQELNKTLDEQFAKMKRGSQAQKELAQNYENMIDKMKLAADTAKAAQEIDLARGRGDEKLAEAIEHQLGLRQHELEVREETQKIEAQLIADGGKITAEIEKQVRAVVQLRHEREREKQLLEEIKKEESDRTAILENRLQLMKTAHDLIQNEIQMRSKGLEVDAELSQRALTLARARGDGLKEIFRLEGEQLKVAEARYQLQRAAAADNLKSALETLRIRHEEVEVLQGKQISNETEKATDNAKKMADLMATGMQIGGKGAEQMKDAIRDINKLKEQGNALDLASGKASPEMVDAMKRLVDARKQGAGPELQEARGMMAELVKSADQVVKSHEASAAFDKKMVEYGETAKKFSLEGAEAHKEAAESSRMIVEASEKSAGAALKEADTRKGGVASAKEIAEIQHRQQVAAEQTDLARKRNEESLLALEERAQSAREAAQRAPGTQAEENAAKAERALEAERARQGRQEGAMRAEARELQAELARAQQGEQAERQGARRAGAEDASKSAAEAAGHAEREARARESGLTSEKAMADAAAQASKDIESASKARITGSEKEREASEASAEAAKRLREDYTKSTGALEQAQQRLTAARSAAQADPSERTQAAVRAAEQEVQQAQARADRSREASMQSALRAQSAIAAVGVSGAKEEADIRERGMQKALADFRANYAQGSAAGKTRDADTERSSASLREASKTAVEGSQARLAIEKEIRADWAEEAKLSKEGPTAMEKVAVAARGVVDSRRQVSELDQKSLNLSTEILKKWDSLNQLRKSGFEDQRAIVGENAMEMAARAHEFREKAKGYSAEELANSHEMKKIADETFFLQRSGRAADAKILNELVDLSDKYRKNREAGAAAAKTEAERKSGLVDVGMDALADKRRDAEKGITDQKREHTALEGKLEEMRKRGEISADTMAKHNKEAMDAAVKSGELTLKDAKLREEYDKRHLDATKQANDLQQQGAQAQTGALTDQARLAQQAAGARARGVDQTELSNQEKLNSLTEKKKTLDEQLDALRDRRDAKPRQGEIDRLEQRITELDQSRIEKEEFARASHQAVTQEGLAPIADPEKLAAAKQRYDELLQAQKQLRTEQERAPETGDALIATNKEIERIVGEQESTQKEILALQNQQGQAGKTNLENAKNAERAAAQQVEATKQQVDLLGEQNALADKYYQILMRGVELRRQESELTQGVVDAEEKRDRIKGTFRPESAYSREYGKANVPTTDELTDATKRAEFEEHLKRAERYANELGDQSKMEAVANKQVEYARALRDMAHKESEFNKDQQAEAERQLGPEGVAKAFGDVGGTSKEIASNISTWLGPIQQFNKYLDELIVKYTRVGQLVESYAGGSSAGGGSANVTPGGLGTNVSSPGSTSPAPSPAANTPVNAEFARQAVQGAGNGPGALTGNVSDAAIHDFAVQAAGTTSIPGAGRGAGASGPIGTPNPFSNY